MPANIHYDGYGSDAIGFDRPVNHLNLYVAAGTDFSFSLDEGNNYVTVPAGFYSIPIGATLRIDISSTGAWSLVAIQA
jgi:hypothetical protein